MIKKEKVNSCTNNIYIDVDKHPVLTEEWKGYYDFKTSGIGETLQWRVGNDGRCPTAKVFMQNMRAFFCFAVKPLQRDPHTQEADHKESGLGIQHDKLSMALLSDSNNVIDFLKYRMARDAGYSSSVLNFISLVRMLLSEKNGYLFDHPEIFAKRIDIPEDEWQSWCKENSEKIAEFFKSIPDRRHISLTRTAAIRSEISAGTNGR